MEYTYHVKHIPLVEEILAIITLNKSLGQLLLHKNPS